MYKKMQTTNYKKTTSGLTPTPFGLNTTGIKLMINTHSEYEYGEQVSVGPHIFYKRLGDELTNILDSNFKWTNVLLSGSLMSGLLETKYNPNKYKQSDLDFYIYGRDSSTVKKHMKRVYSYFVNKFKKMYCFRYNHTLVLTLLSPEYHRSIQIIGATSNDPVRILKMFDMTHCQLGYDGEKLIYTTDFIKSFRSRISRITTHSIHAYRLVKAHLRGYSIMEPRKLYIKNVSHNYSKEKKVNGMPINRDKVWNHYNLSMDELMENKIVIFNLNKNYIPSEDETLDEVNENLIKHYSDNIEMIFDPQTVDQFLDGHNIFMMPLHVQLYN